MKPLCRHCNRESATRPRGLGAHCYHTPAIRRLYPVNVAGREAGVPYDNDFYGGHQLAEHPTQAEPGSDQKIAVMAGRARRHESLWHPWDREIDIT